MNSSLALLLGKLLTGQK